MKKIAVIPARYNASRFPGKLMADLSGKSVIVRTYEAVAKTKLFDEVFVVTDSEIIFDEIISHNGKAIMSKKNHETGSDRIAEAVENLNVDIVVNVQGDEPFTKKEPLEKLLKVFEGEDSDKIDVATLVQEITDKTQINDPNFVKVVADKFDFAMYFSRSPIPYERESSSNTKVYEHIGVYAFRKQALIDFYNQEMLQNEYAEKIECLRYLEYGKKIKLVETKYMGIEIDTPQDLENAQKYFKN